MSNRGRSFGSVSVSQCGMPASCESLTVKRIQELLDREKEATEKVDVENSMYTSFLAKVRRDLEHTSTVAAKSLFIKLFETEPDCVRKLQLHQKCEIAQYAYELLKDNVSRLYWEFADKKRDAEVIIEHCYESVLSLGHFESELRKLVSASTEGVANMHITAEEFERFNRWTIRKKNAQLDELRLANIYTTSLIKQKKRRLRRLCEQEDDRISKMDIQKEVLICHLRRKTINDLSEALMSTKKYVATVNDKFRQVFDQFREAQQTQEALMHELRKRETMEKCIRKASKLGSECLTKLQRTSGILNRRLQNFKVPAVRSYVDILCESRRLESGLSQAIRKKNMSELMLVHYRKMWARLQKP